MAVDTQNKSAWTGKDVSEREINLLNQRVIQFTDIEDTFLDVWLQLENANLDELAAKVLNAGLLFEHYLSQLPNNPTQRESRGDCSAQNLSLRCRFCLRRGKGGTSICDDNRRDWFKYDVYTSFNGSQDRYADLLVLPRVSGILGRSGGKHLERSGLRGCRCS